MMLEAYHISKHIHCMGAGVRGRGLTERGVSSSLPNVTINIHLKPHFNQFNYIYQCTVVSICYS